MFRVKDFTGMGTRLPLTMAALTVAALSMIGLPPTAGFFSKYYLALAAIESGQLAFLVALVVSSLLSAVYFFRVIERAYLMERDNNGSGGDEGDEDGHEGPITEDTDADVDVVQDGSPGKTISATIVWLNTPRSKTSTARARIGASIATGSSRVSLADSSGSIKYALSMTRKKYTALKRLEMTRATRNTNCPDSIAASAR